MALTRRTSVVLRRYIADTSHPYHVAVSMEKAQDSLRFLLNYTMQCNKLFDDLQWQVVGYAALSPFPHRHENMGGSTQEIKRCPSCWTYFDHRKDDQTHAPNCSLASLFALFPLFPRFTRRQDSVLQAFSVVNGYIESNSHPPAVNSFQYGLSPVPQPGLPAILPPSGVPFYPPSFDPSQMTISCDLPDEASCVCIFKSMRVRFSRRARP